MNQTFFQRWGKVSLPNKLTVICTLVIAVATVFYVVASFRQLDKMTATLAEMKANREGSTDQASQVIGNLNWAARSQAEELNKFVDANYRTLRPYISVNTLQLIGSIADGQKFSGTAQVVNSGRTPAVDVRVCGDILLTIATSPITDDYACPNPDMPKRPNLVRSVASIGAGALATVSSPGTIPLLVPKPGSPPAPPNAIHDSLLAGKLTLYFYGRVIYRDLINSDAVHRTDFCGIYNFEASSWVVCDRHTRTD
jgi:hypothetical protein